MNDAIHQLMQVILQGVTWVLRTIERLWAWAWSQIESAFNMSWGNLPAWKVVLGVIAIAVMVVIVVRILIRLVHGDCPQRRLRPDFLSATGLLFEHDLVRKPVSTFRDHALTALHAE